MRFYYNENLKSTIAAQDHVVIGSIGFNEIDADRYHALTKITDKPYFRDTTEELSKEESLFSDSDETEDESETEEFTAEVPVNDVIAGILSTEYSESEHSPALEMDESVAELEEEVASNSFERISELREHADKTRSAKVTKGKAHGVYGWDGEAWVRTGDI